MRTTLKKGIGRAAAANGNGHAILPPGALTPVTLYRQPPPPRRGVAARVGTFFLWAGAMLAGVVPGVGGGFSLWAHESVALLRPTSAEGQQTQARLDPPKSAAIALVLGYDHRAGEGSAPSRSDTMMLIRADPVTNTISMLSFPRDLTVPIYCPAKGGGPDTGYGTGRINSAYAYCGLGGALETVRHLTNLPINYLIPINFLGFIGVVNKLGGVWLGGDRRYSNKNVGTSSTDFANINLQPGYQHLTGKQALDFVRFRHTDSDLYRLARQQLFVGAERQQVAKSLGLSTVLGIVNTVTQHHYMEVERGGRTVNLGDIKKYASFAYNLPHGHVFQVKIGDITGENELSTSQSAIDDAVQQFLNPDVGQASVQTAAALGRKLPARKRTIPPKDVSLTVLNGNGVAGSASNASYLLSQKGYVALTPASGQPANAPNWNYFHSKVYFDPAHAATGKLAAQQVAKLIGSADVEPLPVQLRAQTNGALLTVIVGSTFHGELTPVVVPTTPVHQPPNIRRDPAATPPPRRAPSRRTPAATRPPPARPSSRCASDCRLRPSTRRSWSGPRTSTPATARRRCGSTRSAASRPCGSPSARATTSTGASRRRTGRTRRC